MLAFITIVLIFYVYILRKKIKKNREEYIYLREPPTNDTPSYVGKIIKGHIDGNDIISTILNLNMKGYINILTEEINGKTKKTLLYTEKNKNIELEEHEMFLLNQLFKNDSKVIFEDYIASEKFKNDFKAFDKMLERKIERYSVRNDNNFKSANRILFLVCFLILGISILYGILQPVTFMLIKNIEIGIITNIIGSAIIFIVIAYKYISYINKKQLINNIMSVKIAYIVCFAILCILVLFLNYNSLIIFLKNEIIWYKIIISLISAIITLLYMINIIRQKDKKGYLFYTIIVLSMLYIVLDCNIALSINIVLLSVYSFMIVPKAINLKDNDYVYKWNCFKKFIEDYSILDQQEENAVLIWERYLIYAISLGVNKKVIKKYSRLAHINLFNDNYYKKFYIEYIDE